MKTDFFKNLRKKFYKKRSTLMVWGIVAVLFFVFFGANFYTIFNLEQQKNALNQQIQEEKERAAVLDAQLAAVGSRAYIEQIAREKYNLYYPDELIVTTEYENKTTQ